MDNPHSFSITRFGLQSEPRQRNQPHLGYGMLLGIVEHARLFPAQRREYLIRPLETRDLFKREPSVTRTRPPKKGRRNFSGQAHCQVPAAAPE